MDHLPNFGASAPIEVPYVGNEAYDGHGFQGYPDRKGWDTANLLRLTFDGRTHEEAASFLQTWLFFGLLFEVIPIDVRMDDFLKLTEDGRSVITTECLSRYIRDWRQHAQGSSPEQNQKEQAALSECFDYVWQFILSYCDVSSRELETSRIPSFTPLDSQWPISPEISLSIMVLADTLSKAAFTIYRIPMSRGSWGISELLVSRMLDAGWCPNVMSILKSTAQTQPLYYASTLGSPRVPKDHASCTEYSCAADQINAASYTTRHRSKGCTCAFVEVPVKHVVEIILKGGLPLINCIELDGAVNIDVQEQEMDTKSMYYIAISHVCRFYVLKSSPDQSC
jgi:hypothetical protein